MNIVLTHRSSLDHCRARNGRMYMPAQADRQPQAFQQWLNRYGGGGPVVSNLADPIDMSAGMLTGWSVCMHCCAVCVQLWLDKTRCHSLSSGDIMGAEVKYPRSLVS